MNKSRFSARIRSNSVLKCLLGGLTLLALLPGMAHAAEGILTVKTDPEGIEVWLNDKYIGDTPIFDKKVNPGQYTVKLVDPIRHNSILEQVFIQAGESTVLEKTLTTKFGTLRITSEPEGADVYLSTPLGKTPFTNEFMNPGKYRLEIQYPNKAYKPVIKDVLIPKGETASLAEKLEKKNTLDRKAMVRLALGAGAAAGFVWAIVEQSKHMEYQTELENNIKDKKTMDDVTREKTLDDDTNSKVKRTLGIVAGSLCIIGFEVVAFF
jgi:hypothetical protein